MPSPYLIRLFPPPMVFPAAGYLFLIFFWFFLIFLYFILFILLSRPKIVVPGCRGAVGCWKPAWYALLTCLLLFQKAFRAKPIPFAKGLQHQLGLPFVLSFYIYQHSIQTSKKARLTAPLIVSSHPVALSICNQVSIKFCHFSPPETVE